jgi:hypothetical protein
MAGRKLEGGAARVRRASRHDLPALRRLLTEAPGGRSERFDRRALRHLGGDVYVVDGPDDTILGAVSLSVVRSFATGGWQAALDGVWVSPAAEALVDPLLAFAMRRAEERHCHDLVVTGPVGDALARVLDRRGCRRGVSWRTALTPVAPKTPRRRRPRSS